MEAIEGEQVRLGSSHMVGRFFALSLNYRRLVNNELINILALPRCG